MSNTSYKTIREISEKLISSLASAGVVLTEEQKADVDAFLSAIESKLDEQKHAAIQATKTVVERRMDEEYKKVMESILKHQDIYNRLLEKIAVAEATKKVTEEMAEAVDGFIGEKLEECIPDETIVDYHRLQSLEKTMAVLKEAMLLGDSEVQQAITESEKRIAESYSKKEKVLRRNLAATRGKLLKAVTESRKMKAEAASQAAERLLEEKTADLPAFEAKEIKKRLAGKSVDEINSRFNAVYESIAGEAVEEAKLSLESEISKILEGGEKKEDKEETSCGKKSTDGDSGESAGQGEEKKQEKVQEQLDEAYDPDAIDGNMMLEWMNASENINMRLF